MKAQIERQRERSFKLASAAERTKLRLAIIARTREATFAAQKLKAAQGIAKAAEIAWANRIKIARD